MPAPSGRSMVSAEVDHAGHHDGRRRSSSRWLLARAAGYFPKVEVVSRRPDRSLHCTNWGAIDRRPPHPLGGACVRGQSRRRPFSKLVFPGPFLHAPSLLELLDAERVTFAAGVPAIWMAILDALEK